ncbi:hypothetical protein ACFP81_11940 [Deinococcus lacus]|uniref:HPt domain-containing protein n=1 Tax=Deinococcus lacus TaxID=392561 RepID=A0ABW1YGG0_9DEIO
MVGLQPLGDFAHRMEDLLGAVRDGQQRLEGPVLDTLEDAADLLGEMMDVAGGADLSVTPRAELLGNRLAALAGGNSGTMFWRESRPPRSPRPRKRAHPSYRANWKHSSRFLPATTRTSGNTLHLRCRST